MMLSDVSGFGSYSRLWDFKSSSQVEVLESLPKVFASS